MLGGEKMVAQNILDRFVGKNVEICLVYKDGDGYSLEIEDQETEFGEIIKDEDTYWIVSDKGAKNLIFYGVVEIKVV